MQAEADGDNGHTDDEHEKTSKPLASASANPRGWIWPISSNLHGIAWKGAARHGCGRVERQAGNTFSLDAGARGCTSHKPDKSQPQACHGPATR